jgi:p21-activated kinase 1
LAQSGITKQDQINHPQAVIDVIGFYSENQQKSQDAVFNKINNAYAQQINPLLMTSSPLITPISSPKLGPAPPKPPRTTTPPNGKVSQTNQKPVVPPRPVQSSTAHVLSIETKRNIYFIKK